MLKIGLTGGICSGKSLVQHIVQELYNDIFFLSADDIAKDLSMQGKELHTQIIEQFGASCVKKDGEIDRKKLAEIVFSNEEQLLILEKMVHPLVRIHLEKKIKFFTKRAKKDKKNSILVEVPLLYEAEYEDLFDLILLVACTEDNQILRCQKRDGLSEDAVRRRMMKQIPLRQKVERADFVIDNNVSMNEMRRQLENLWSKIIQKN